jgi:hypothetical protein
MCLKESEMIGGAPIHVQSNYYLNDDKVAKSYVRTSLLGHMISGMTVLSQLPAAVILNRCPRLLLVLPFGARHLVTYVRREERLTFPSMSSCGYSRRVQ